MEIISEHEILFCIAGQLYSQSPDRNPRKSKAIMLKARDKIRGDFENMNEFYHCETERPAMEKYIHDILFGIPEFEELNLSQIEFENGITVDNPDRPKFSFTSRYDKETPESWKNDFVDLDAFERNVFRKFWQLKDAEKDCCGCGWHNTERCGDCVRNKNRHDLFEMPQQDVVR